MPSRLFSQPAIPWRPGSPRPRLCLRRLPHVVCSDYLNNPNRIPEWEQRLRRSRTRYEGRPSGFSLIRLVAPHRTLGVLDRFRAVLAGADPHGVLNSDDEDLAVAALAVAASTGDRQLVDHRCHDLRFHDRLNLEPRPKRYVHGRPAVLLGIAALGAASLDLCDRHTRHAALVQHVLDLLQPFVADDRDDHLHVESTSVRRHAGDTSFCLAGTVSWLGCGLTVGVSAGRQTPPGTGMNDSG